MGDPFAWDRISKAERVELIALDRYLHEEANRDKGKATASSGATMSHEEKRRRFFEHIRKLRESGG